MDQWKERQEQMKDYFEISASIDYCVILETWEAQKSISMINKYLSQAKRVQISAHAFKWLPNHTYSSSSFFYINKIIESQSFLST